MGRLYALIDAGTALDRDFLSKLKSVVPLNQIEIVILTHGYYDHVGHAAKLQKDYGTKIAIHQKDYEKAAKGIMDFPKAKGIFSNSIRKSTMKEMDKAKFTAFNADIVINGKEQVLQYPQAEKCHTGFSHVVFPIFQTNRCVCLCELRLKQEHRPQCGKQATNRARCGILYAPPNSL